MLIDKPLEIFRIKANRLNHFLRLLTDRFAGPRPRREAGDLPTGQSGLEALLALPTTALRETILGVRGIGPETADSILLYAADRPVFVVDAYTARILHRHGLIDRDATYDDIQALLQGNLPDDVPMLKEYHALLVEVGKRHCRKRAPRCSGCPLEPYLGEGQPVSNGD